MGLLIRRPHSAGELLDLALAVTKRHFWSLFRLGALPLAIAVLLDFLLRVVGAGQEWELLAILPVFVCMGIAESRMIVAAWQLLHEQPIDPISAQKQVWLRLVPVVLGYSVKWTLALLGIFLLIVPGVMVLLWWFAVPTVTVIERRGFWSSMRRSRDLARGQKKRLLGTLGVFDLAVIVLSVGFTMLYGDSATGELPLWADATTWAVTLLLFPFRATLMAAVYTDIRVRLEGYDLEAEASQLAGVA